MSYAIALAGVHVLAVVWLIRRNGPWHPASLWCLAFAVTTTLFALHLLPYKPMALATAALVAAGGASFCGGALLADRLGRGRSPRPLPGLPPRINYSGVAAAAVVALAVLAVWLGAFIVELTSQFGLRATLVSDPAVREELHAGTATVTIKYVYLTLCAAGLFALAAALAPTRRARTSWLVAVGAAAFAAYFSTGRANIVMPLLVGGVVFFLARGVRLSLTRTGAAALAGAAVVLAIFIMGGSIIGKTLANNPLGSVPSVFTEHSWLEPLALPYEYATAPLAALDVQRRSLAATPSTDGCATFAVVCQIAARAGLAVEPVPRIRPFTADPIAWNTYTALDLPLLDAGPGGVVAFFLAVGLLAGVLHRRAAAGLTAETVAYGILCSAILYAPVQNNFTAPHVVGAILLVPVMLAAGITVLGVDRAARILSAGPPYRPASP